MRKYPNRKHHRVFGIICISCLSFCFSLKLHNDADVKEQACMHASMYDCVLNNNSSLVAILANFHHCFRQTETTPEKSKQASFGDK
ncbi:hypothetical protein T02_7071 [Trichinella nativa]|uniref:Secreted protein n=1 Tax=Trichinella nativa TaxID=6335 RepID=A0A0V1LHN1_9BILA|nr:hypothetical protein T02_7071 [Trichinella nativa]